MKSVPPTWCVSETSRRLRSGSHPDSVQDLGGEILWEDEDGERRDGNLEGGDGEHHEVGPVALDGDTDGEAELLAPEGVKQGDPARGPEYVEDVVSDDAEPHPVEVAEVEGIGGDDGQHREVVERLAVFAEVGVDVRKERAEHERHEHGGDLPERRGVARGFEDEPDADRQQHGVQHVPAFVHDCARAGGVTSVSLRPDHPRSGQSHC